METKDLLRETVIFEIKKYIIPIDIKDIISSSAKDMHITYVLKDMIVILNQKSYQEGIALKDALPYRVDPKVESEIKSFQKIFQSEVEGFLTILQDRCSQEITHSRVFLPSKSLKEIKTWAIVLLTLYVNCPYLAPAEVIDNMLRRLIFYKILF